MCVCVFVLCRGGGGLCVVCRVSCVVCCVPCVVCICVFCSVSHWFTSYIASTRRYAQIESRTYSLSAVVVHRGVAVLGGHFFTYTRNPQTIKWRKFDDAKPVVEVDRDVVLNHTKIPLETAYGLLYTLD